MLKFSKTDRRDRKSTSSLESCATVENGRQIIYRKVSQQDPSLHSVGSAETSSIGTNDSDDFIYRTYSLNRDFNDSERTSSSMMYSSTSDDNITRHVYTPTEHFNHRRSHSSISEENIDGLDNIDCNHNVVSSNVVLKKNKKIDYGSSRDVYIVGTLPRHRTSLSFNEEYRRTDFNYKDLRFNRPKNVKSEGKDLTTIDVNENFASPTTTLRESPPPMRRRFITQPTTEYEHTPPEQLRSRSRDILRSDKFTTDTTTLNRRSRSDTEGSGSSTFTKSDRKIYEAMRNNNKQRNDSDSHPEKTTDGPFRRFSEMRQQVKKICKSEKTRQIFSKIDSSAESINENADSSSIGSPDSVFNSPHSIARSLTQSDRSFSADSETQEITNRLDKIQFGKYYKNDVCQFDFDIQETAYLRKPSPLSSADSQYYGSGSSLSSAGIGHQASKTDIMALTSDMLVNIFTYLSTYDICQISKVCRRWYDVYLSLELWEKISITNLNDLEIDEIINMLLQRLSFKTTHGCLCIKSIQLNGCVKLTNNGIKTISRRCPELRSLEIASCFNVTGKGLYDALTNCPNLVYLNSSHCEEISDFSMLSEVNLKLLESSSFGDMRYIDLSGCTSLTDGGLRDLLKCTTLLEYLYLRECDSISNVGLGSISVYCKNLKELSLNDCYNITDAGVEKIAKGCTKLRYLSVAKCPISDAAVTFIATYGLELRHLNMYECENITDVGVMNIANSCPRMRSLDIGRCIKITDATLYILSRCTKIRRLNLKGCVKVTDAGLRKLATHCNNIRHLDVRQCILSSETFLYIKRHCHVCDIEYDHAEYC